MTLTKHFSKKCGLASQNCYRFSHQKYIILNGFCSYQISSKFPLWIHQLNDLLYLGVTSIWTIDSINSKFQRSVNRLVVVEWWSWYRGIDWLFSTDGLRDYIMAKSMVSSVHELIVGPLHCNQYTPINVVLDEWWMIVLHRDTFEYVSASVFE